MYQKEEATFINVHVKIELSGVLLFVKCCITIELLKENKMKKISLRSKSSVQDGSNSRKYTNGNALSSIVRSVSMMKAGVSKFYNHFLKILSCF